ncbi:hypothetical protein E3N88_35285 [Mikania micrantha]|uniref:Uncharacterized protein n=1 Tax=Mikania micrantha TaxID=192012 RepID=A0A5N6M0I7_9ASTR|nr:hypothetical protein E3N88_35285 [Mikania micrantha]
MVANIIAPQYRNHDIEWKTTTAASPLPEPSSPESDRRLSAVVQRVFSTASAVIQVRCVRICSIGCGFSVFSGFDIAGLEFVFLFRLTHNQLKNEEPGYVNIPHSDEIKLFVGCGSRLIGLSRNLDMVQTMDKTWRKWNQPENDLACAIEEDEDEDEAASSVRFTEVDANTVELRWLVAYANLGLQKGRLGLKKVPKVTAINATRDLMKPFLSFVVAAMVILLFGNGHAAPSAPVAKQR